MVWSRKFLQLWIGHNLYVTKNFNPTQMVLRVRLGVVLYSQILPRLFQEFDGTISEELLMVGHVSLL